MENKYYKTPDNKEYIQVPDFYSDDLIWCKCFSTYKNEMYNVMKFELTFRWVGLNYIKNKKIYTQITENEFLTALEKLKNDFLNHTFEIVKK